jgi:hypothetical protein
MFRQDYRINKIFLYFQPVPLRAGKKCKKHHPSSKKGFQSLRQQKIKAKEKVSRIDSPALFPRSEIARFHGFIPVRHRLRFR